MKNRLFFIVVVLLCCKGAIYAQVALDWIQQIGSAGEDLGYAIALDDTGNVYTTGYFSGTADFDPGPGTYNLNSCGYNDGFISKVDANGNLVWARQVCGSSNDYGRGIAVDTSGNVYVTGVFGGTADFNPGTGTYYLTATNWEGYILKLDAGGNFAWANKIGGPDSDHAYTVAIDSVGDVFITGSFNGKVDFDPGAGIYELTSFGSGDVYILKLTSDGDFLWAKQVGSGGNDYAHSLILDSLNNIHLAGSIQGVADFDPGPETYNTPTYGNTDNFVCKLNHNGEFIWAKSFGSAAYDNTEAMALDSDGNVFVTGYFYSLDFNTGTEVYKMTSSGGNNVYILKLDANGNYIWGKQFGGSSAEYSHGIFVDSDNNIYTTGKFYATADFDPGPGIYNLTPVNYFDIFVSALDADGNFLWAEGFGGTNDDCGYAVKKDASGNLYTTGTFRNTVDFDPGITDTLYLTSAGLGDYFLQKLKPCTNTYNSINIIACDSFIAPDGAVYTTSGIKTAIISNTAGCDSIITIDLTIKQSTSSSITVSTCDSYTAPDGNIYTTSGTKVAVIPNATGCDSTITIDLTIKQSTSSSITVSTCDSYTAPDGNIYTTFGTKVAVIPNAAGCDSTITIDLTIKQSTSSSITVSTCDSYTAPDGNIYSTSGTKVAVIPNAAGCDSTITIDLTIKQSTSSSITESTCESYTAPDGNIYTTSGTKVAVIPNAAGCDSTITIDLTIKQSTSSSITESTCDSYTAPDGNIYTTSGTKVAVIPNAAGCDSTITIDLVIKQSTSSSITESTCDSYTAPDGNIYTTSGTKVAVIPNAAGCDSTITIDLTIKYSTASSITETACDSYTAPDGNVYTTSGTKVAVVPNAAGCDSTITIDLTIITVDASVVTDNYTISAITSDAIYQWLDCSNNYATLPEEINQSYTATSNGSYAVTVTQGACSDTSECINIVGVGVIESTFDFNIIIYPNPTEGLFNIDLGNITETVNVTINDMQGQVIRRQIFKNEKLLKLSIEEPAGIYIITLLSGEKRAIIKLIKY